MQDVVSEVACMERMHVGCKPQDRAAVLGGMAERAVLRWLDDHGVGLGSARPM